MTKLFFVGTDKLLAWKNGTGKKNAIRIEGARRVGKSTVASED